MRKKPVSYTHLDVYKRQGIRRAWLFIENVDRVPDMKEAEKQRFMNNYETVFILTPVLSDAQMKEAVEKFTNLLKEQGAEIVNEENWGLRKLAYPIDKKTTGFYQLVEFKANPETIATLEINFRRDERVIRFLTFKMDKYAAEYAAKRRNVKSTKKED